MAKKHKLPKITKKVLSSIIIAGFLLCTILFIGGSVSFSRQFRSQYDRSIRSIGLAARETLNPDDFARYLETKTPDETYFSVLKILQDFVDKFELNLLYVSSVKGEDYTDITYIYNPVMKEGKWTPFPLGYSEEYIEKENNEASRRVYEQGETVVRHTMKTRSGSHITANLPIYDSQGNIVAVLGVQKSIQEFVDARYSFMTLAITFEVLFTIAFIILFTAFFNYNYIKPIILVTREAERFAAIGEKPGEVLSEIRSSDEIGTLAKTVRQMEIDICDGIERLKVVTAEKERIGAELNLASQIQQEALPKAYPAFPERSDFDLYASMESAKEVGGDFYDYLLLDDDHIMLVVGDVSGKGVPAALFMMTAKTLIASYAEQGLSPKEIFERTNNQLCKGNETNLFVTCWLGILNLKTGKLDFVNAGHPFPVLYKDKEFSYLKTKTNFVLGGIESIKYDEHSISLSKGDRIFIYTDGVTEAINKDEELFGEERLLKAISQTSSSSVPSTIKTIRDSIEDFVSGCEQFDDITMLNFAWEKPNTDIFPDAVLTLDAKVANMEIVQNFVENQIQDFCKNKKILMKINLVIEEIFVNIVQHGYEDKGGDIKIYCSVKNDENPSLHAKIVFEDSGIPFNPLEKPDPDITLPAEKRGIGGLGIFITKKYMSKVEYEYKDGKNILTLIKNLDEE